MKKKVFVRPVSVTFSEEVFRRIYDITERKEISISDYIRDAVQQKLSKSTETNS